MISINLIQAYQKEDVKCLIFTICEELFQLYEDVIREFDAMSDIDDVESHYFDKRGTFLVVTDEEKVVGSGAIRRLDHNVCELKRMWLLKDYRGQGLGMKMAQMLLDFARSAGYKKVRLDLLNPQQQTQALKLYQQLGFYVIARYNDTPCTVFREKVL
ncbi:MAG TPA: GNAT family N-acetyltransferase [Waterburya sp.]|jgi:putative acetyltransferase